MSVIGRSVPRLEDERLLRGQGRFHDDVVRPGQLWLRVVRSPVAHARIRGIDTTAALGFRVWWTSSPRPTWGRCHPSAPAAGAGDRPHAVPAEAAGQRVRPVRRRPGGGGRGEDPYLAEDAAERVVLDLEELPVALDARTAADTRPESWAGASAEVGVVEFGYGDVDAVMESAPRRLARPACRTAHRYAVGAAWSRGRVRRPHRPAHHLGCGEGAALQPPGDGPDAPLRRAPYPHGGGGRGRQLRIRGEFYPEDLLVPFLALRTGRPVKWSEDRY